MTAQVQFAACGVSLAGLSGREPIVRLCELGATTIGVATEIFGGQHLSLGQQIGRARRWSRRAIEISALTDSDLRTAQDILDGGELPFDRVTLHAPLSIPAGGERVVVATLAGVSAQLAGIIVHPGTADDLRPFHQLGRLLLIENMDCAKDAGRSAAELRPYFSLLPEAGLCLDVAHAWTMDHSLRVGMELLDAHPGRVRQIHISGIREDGAHTMLTAEHIGRYAPLLRRCVHLPWIVESPPAGIAADAG